MNYVYLWQIKGMEKSEHLDRNCRLCGQSDQHTMEHFIYLCQMLNGIRAKCPSQEDCRTYMESPQTIIEILRDYKGYAPSK